MLNRKEHFRIGKKESSMTSIYLDYAATTPMDPRVREAMAPYWETVFGNPMSLHSHGQKALEGVEAARDSVARLIGADSPEIVFTGCGTESDNAAIKGVAFARGQGGHIITTAVEHHAVLHACRFLEKQGFDLSVVSADRFGRVNPDDIKDAITSKTILISVMHANNEVGTIEPIEAIGALARDRGISFHTDAVQTAGHLPIHVDTMNIDLLALSAHKFCGPKGVGALYIRKGTPFEPLLHGGAQEGGRRSATHNVPGIVGLGKAAEIAMKEMEDENRRIDELRRRLLNRLMRDIPDTCLNGHPEERLPNNINLSFAQVEGEALLMHLDHAGISASSGSACSSGSEDPSHVLLAMGLSPEKARGSLRLSLGRFTTREEIDRAAEAVIEAVGRLRELSPAGKS